MFDKGFSQDKLISYSGMLWLLAAQIVVMLPLLFHLPIWIFPILFFSAYWRIRVMQGKQQQPNTIIKIVLGLIGIGGLILNGTPLMSLDTMASLLMLGFAYKALEVIKLRDGIVIILTGFVLVGVTFLYSQSILITLYSFLSMTLLTGALNAIHQSGLQTSAQTTQSVVKGNLRHSALMLFLCLPLMILFFIFMPRFEPLWRMSFGSGQAQTGMSDSMTPGDISNLSQSDGLAFSVNFLGERPQQQDLYWRGMVLPLFDGKSWTRPQLTLPKDRFSARRLARQNDANNLFKQQGDAIEYEMIYEKTGRQWLYALTPVSNIQGQGYTGDNFTIVANKELNEPLMLKLTSYPQSKRQIDLSESIRKRNLTLPENINPKSRTLAQQLLATSSSHQDYAQKLLDHYTKEEFFYSLKPDRMNSENTIDEFLFEKRKGFCEHYSSSFVFMLRAAGIPARVVVGYQGGEWNERANFLSVKQYDAHAWAEAWFEGQGWVRFDPTASVAPSRIEKNLETAVASEGTFLANQVLSMNKVKWLNNIRLRMDAVQYQWRRMVLGYDAKTQRSFLENTFGELSLRKMMLIIGAGFIGIIFVWAVLLGLTGRRKTEATEHLLYQRFCKLLEKRGITRDVSQTPNGFANLASSQLPEISQQIDQFISNYSTLCYDPKASEYSERYFNGMKSALKELKTL